MLFYYKDTSLFFKDHRVIQKGIDGTNLLDCNGDSLFGYSVVKEVKIDAEKEFENVVKNFIRRFK